LGCPIVVLAQTPIMTRCGSILWMAPEIISGDTFNEKIDVYSCHLRGPRRAHHRSQAEHWID
jgi:serine/threonine protein kinase